MKLIRKVMPIFDRAVSLAFYLTCILVVFAMLAVCFDVGARYFLDRPQVWVVPVTEYVLLFMTFLGVAWVLRTEGHVKMDLVLNRLKPGSRDILNIITSIIVVVICLAITWYSAQTTWDHFQRGVSTVKMEGVPVAPIMVVVPVGSFLLFIQSLRRTYGYLGRWRAPREQKQRS